MKFPFAVSSQARRALDAHPELVPQQDEKDSSRTSSSSSAAAAECAMVFALVAEALKEEDQAQEWRKRLGSVFIFEIIDSPARYTLDLLTPSSANQSIVSLSSDGPANTAAITSRSQTVHIRLTAKDLLGVAVGERLPVRLWARGRIQIKGSVEKALTLGRLLSLTREQVYADASTKAPRDDLDRLSIKKYAATAGAGAGYDGSDTGLGVGAGSGGSAEIGTALGAQKGVVRAAKL